MLESERSLWLMSAMGSRGLIGGDLGVLCDCRDSELLGFDNYVQFWPLHLQYVECVILSLKFCTCNIKV